MLQHISFQEYQPPNQAGTPPLARTSALHLLSSPPTPPSATPPCLQPILIHLLSRTTLRPPSTQTHRGRAFRRSSNGVLDSVVDTWTTEQKIFLPFQPLGQALGVMPVQFLFSLRYCSVSGIRQPMKTWPRAVNRKQRISPTATG